MHEFVKRIHFVGIGGIGMSGIAEVLLELGFEVSGSDIAHSPILKRLANAGVRVMQGHHADNIADAEAVVVSSAVADNNVEVVAARNAKIAVVPRAQMLGELMRFRQGIAIAGTHGKTTTTSLVAGLLAEAGLDPTFIVGGVINSVRSNARLGKGAFMVVEADESDASFLHLSPQMAVMTNIDADHLEAYQGDFDELKKNCLGFLRNLPFYGLAILCFEDEVVREISTQLNTPIVSYGFGEGVDFRAVEVRQEGRESCFRLARGGEVVGDYRLALPGRHNVLNALAAIAVATQLKVATQVMAKSLREFQGISRRFEVYDDIALPQGACTLVDDYAHHPNELRATLEAVQACWLDRRLVVVFQPHRYTRTRDLFDEFVAALSGLEVLIITQVYAAGETALSQADAQALCRSLRKLGGNPLCVEHLAELPRALSNILQPEDVLLTMGAGDIGRFAQHLAEKGLANLEEATGD